MNLIDIESQRVLVIGLVSTGLIIARRWKNEDARAGYGIAGWTIFIIFTILTA
jgi:hypothetical protein